jgi:hypothetical protein
MPFKSKQQVKYLFSQEPQLAKKWRKENPKQNLKALPKKVKPQKKS